MKVTALCLVGAVLAALLKKSSPELALLLALAACAAVLLALVRGVETVTAFVREVMQWGGVESALFAPLFKTVAIALISRTGADLCRDAGEGAMASLVETAGAFGAVVVSLPQAARLSTIAVPIKRAVSFFMVYSLESYSINSQALTWYASSIVA